MIKNRKTVVLFFYLFLPSILIGQDFGLSFALGKEYFEDREILLVDFSSIEVTPNFKRSGSFAYAGLNYEINLFKTFQFVPELGFSYFNRPLTRRYSFPFGAEIMENLKLRSLRIELRMPLQIKLNKFSPKVGIATQQAIFRHVVADDGVFKFKEVVLDQFYYSNWSVFGQLEYDVNDKIGIYLIAEEYFLNYLDIFDPFIETIRNNLRVQIGLTLALSKP